MGEVATIEEYSMLFHQDFFPAYFPWISGLGFQKYQEGISLTLKGDGGISFFHHPC